MATVTDVRKIERVALTHVGDLEAELRGQVLVEANRNFGYVADSFGAAGPLAVTLKALDITPLKTEQVEAYKAHKERVTVTNLRPWIHLLITGAAFLLGAVISFGIYDTAAQKVAAGGKDSPLVNWTVNSAGPDTLTVNWFPIIMGLVIPTLILAFIGNMIFDVALDGILPRRTFKWRWATFTLGENYPRYIPLHILNIANQIKAVRPKTSFHVDELTVSVEEHEPQPVLDPFLWVSLGPEKYYIAVWDEREFEARA